MRSFVGAVTDAQRERQDRAKRKTIQMVIDNVTRITVCTAQRERVFTHLSLPMVLAAARRDFAVRAVLAAAQRLPLGERRGRFRVCDAPQLDRLPVLPLARHVVRLLQSVRLLLAQRQFSRRRENVRPSLFPQRLVRQRSQTAAEHHHAQHDRHSRG